MYYTYHKRFFSCLVLITGLTLIFFLSGCTGSKIVKEDRILKEKKEEPNQGSQVLKGPSGKTQGAKTGKIAGVVKDPETGDLLPGANVVIEGTTMGSATDIEGYYVILNVPVGVYSVRSALIGYKDVVVENVRVSASSTTELNFQLEETTLEVESIIIVKEKEESPDTIETQTSGYTIDSLLANFPYGNIAFNTPPRMNLKETAYVQLLLDLTKSVAELKRMIKEKGNKEGDSIKVAPKMEARLIGSHFEIEAIYPEVQPITKQDVTEWKWEITPKDVGDHELHLTLNAIVTLQGDKSTRLIKAFDRTLRVEVTWGQRASGFFSQNWQWLWAVIVVPVAGWLWKKTKKIS